MWRPPKKLQPAGAGREGAEGGDERKERDEITSLTFLQPASSPPWSLSPWAPHNLVVTGDGDAPATPHAMGCCSKFSHQINPTPKTNSTHSVMGPTSRATPPAPIKTAREESKAPAPFSRPLLQILPFEAPRHKQRGRIHASPPSQQEPARSQGRDGRENILRQEKKPIYFGKAGSRECWSQGSCSRLT